MYEQSVVKLYSDRTTIKEHCDILTISIRQGSNPSTHVGNTFLRSGTFCESTLDKLRYCGGAMEMQLQKVKNTEQ
jgi:hypothetical protein